MTSKVVSVPHALKLYFNMVRAPKKLTRHTPIKNSCNKLQEKHSKTWVNLQQLNYVV